MPPGVREAQPAHEAVSTGQKTGDAGDGCIPFDPNGSDAPNPAERNLSHYRAFAEKHRHIIYNRILRPGVDLAAILYGYGMPYKKLTGHPYDETAPKRVLPGTGFYGPVNISIQVISNN